MPSSRALSAQARRTVARYLPGVRCVTSRHVDAKALRHMPAAWARRLACANAFKNKLVGTRYGLGSGQRTLVASDKRLAYGALANFKTRCLNSACLPALTKPSSSCAKCV